MYDILEGWPCEHFCTLKADDAHLSWPTRETLPHFPKTKIIIINPIPRRLGAAAASMPVQQILIPVSAANGTQQLLSIPLSLATGGGGHGNHIQLLTTSNGSVIATNLAGLAQQQQNVAAALPTTPSTGTTAYPFLNTVLNLLEKKRFRGIPLLHGNW